MCPLHMLKSPFWMRSSTRRLNALSLRHFHSLDLVLSEGNLELKATKTRDVFMQSMTVTALESSHVYVVEKSPNFYSKYTEY